MSSTVSTEPKKANRLPPHIVFAKRLPGFLAEGGVKLLVPTKTKNTKMKISGIQPTKSDGFYDRLTVILDGEGFFPSFALNATQSGGQSLTFPVTDSKEQVGLQNLDQMVFDQLIGREFWPELESPPSREVLATQYNKLIRDPKPKTDGSGHWPPQMKVTIPLKEDGTPKDDVKIVDTADQEVSMHELAGRKFHRIVFEIHFIYFKPKECGIVKKLKMVKVAPSQGDGLDSAAIYEYFQDEEETIPEGTIPEGTVPPTFKEEEEDEKKTPPPLEEEVEEEELNMDQIFQEGEEETQKKRPADFTVSHGKKKKQKTT